MIDVSIIIITWQAKKFLRECLDSICQSDFQGSSELIVVDNGSFDGAVELLKKEYPQAILIENKNNQGVAKARNQGLKIAKGRYCLLLDVDAVLAKHTLRILIQAMDKGPQIGIAGPKLLYPDGGLQYSCRSFPNPIAVLLRGTFLGKLFPNNYFLRKYLLKDFAHNTAKQVDWVMGACQLIRQEVFQDIGYLDEHYFFALEDTDFCFRAKQNGWKALYYPQAKAIHHYQRNSAKRINRLKLEHIKSLIRFFCKRYFSSRICL